MTPDDPEALRRQIAELQARLAQAERPQVARRIDGGVDVRHGDFVAGDKIVLEPGESAEDVRTSLEGYLQALSHDLAGLRLGDIDAAANVQQQQPLRLADVYVPLDTTLTLPEKLSLSQWLAEPASATRGEDAGERRRVAVTEALAQHRVLTLLGAPGSGKTSFGARMLLALAQAWLGHEGEMDALGRHWRHGKLLPLRVVLRRFADSMPTGSAPLRAGDLWTHVERDIADSGWGDGAALVRQLRRIERRQGLLVVFDGLDECGDESARTRVRAAVEEFVAAGSSASRYLLTARPYAGPDQPSAAKGEYRLAELDEVQVDAFIAQWYEALARTGWLANPAQVASHQEDLQAAARRADLRDLAANPLLLTLMASLHTHRGRLPDDRADLYQESVNLLLQRWTQAKGSDRALADQVGQPIRFDQLRQALEQLAFEVHESCADAAEPSRAADIAEHRLLHALTPLLAGSRDKAAQVADFIERRAGLLLGQGHRDGERQFSFPHRTFQEFMAACHLARRERFVAECLRLARADAGHWQVVLPLAARLAGSERGALAADNLVGARGIDAHGPAPQPADWTNALLAGLMLREIGTGAVCAQPAGQATLGRVAGWLAASLPVHPSRGGAPAPERAYAGEVLAALGDPRFDPERLFLPRDACLGFVPVPGAPAYLIGARAEDRARVDALFRGGATEDDEINDRPVAVAPFWIGRNLVTVAQFRAYVDLTGRAPGDRDALRDPPNHPVRWVNWHEALAYCQWLGEQLQGHPRLAGSDVARAMRRQGLEACLPSELEWELAARGGQDHAIFPWGDDADATRANVAGAGIDSLCAVGCFEPNAWGLHDMAGNLWEWTRSRYAPYPYQVDLDREGLASQEDDRRVLRGGGFFNVLHGARCARRYHYLPGDRSYGFGFRVVLRCAPET